MLDWRAIEGAACLITSAVPGVSADQLSASQLADAWPAITTTHLRLHSVRADTCPFDRTLDVMMPLARATVAERRVQTEFLPQHVVGTPPEVLLAGLERDLPHREAQERDATGVCRGDFCLPNIVIDPETLQVTGLIDLGRLGRADPYADLALLLANARETWPDEATTRFRGPRFRRNRFCKPKPMHGTSVWVHRIGLAAESGRGVRKDGRMEQLNEIRAMNEGLGDLTDNLNPEFFGSYPVNTTLAPHDAYGRRKLNVFNLTDVDGRALITDGRPNPGFELLYAAHAEMAAVVSISSRGINRGDFRMESFWVSRHGITRSRFARLPESDDGILWLTPFERLVPEVLEIAALGNSTFVPDGLRAPVKRDEVKPHRPMAQQTAAIAKAIRKEWPDAAKEIEAGNVREVSLHVTSVNKYGVHENENSWIVTPVGAVMVFFEKERMLRADTFVTGMSLYELRREIDDLLPGEADRRDWEQLAEQTGAVRIDTSIPA